MCRWFVYLSNSEPCLLEDVLVSSKHSLTVQVHEHFLPMLMSKAASKGPSAQAEPTTQAEITARNRLFNVDGFGMAWYTPTLSSFSTASGNATQREKLHPALYKSIQPPLHDLNFRSICSNTASNVLFAHVRAATSTAVVSTNNHPFTFGIHSIMHNGYISDFEKIKLKMSTEMSQDAYQHIQGGTDTEHFAALLMTFLCSNSKAQATPNPYPGQEGKISVPAEWEEYHSAQQMHAALQSTISALINIQKSILGSKAQPNDLNIAITDGKSLVACRFRNHATEQPPSLYYSTVAGVTLNRLFPDHPDGAKGPHGSGKGKSAGGKTAAPGAEGHNPHAKRNAGEHGAHIIVASEPTTYKEREWTLIKKNTVLLVDTEGKLVVEQLAYQGNEQPT